MGVLSNNVFLVGFMGVGKTTVGRRLARELGAAFIDVDAYLHRKHGKDATSLFRQRGEAGLRRAEAKALAECAAMGPAVISCGEGIVASQRAREILRTQGCAIWLESSAEASLARIKNLRTRPLLAQGCDTDELWEARRPLYEEVAAARVNVANMSTGRAAFAIVDVLKEQGVYVEGERAGNGKGGTCGGGSWGGGSRGAGPQGFAAKGALRGGASAGEKGHAAEKGKARSKGDSDKPSLPAKGAPAQTSVGEDASSEGGQRPKQGSGRRRNRRRRHGPRGAQRNCSNAQGKGTSGNQGGRAERGGAPKEA